MRLLCIVLLVVSACGQPKQKTPASTLCTGGTPPQSGQPLLAVLPDMQLGGGYNSLLREAAGDCLSTDGATTLDGDVGGPTASFQLKLIEDANDLHTALNVSATAGIDAGPVDLSLGGGYVTDERNSKYSTYLVVDTAVTYMPRRLTRYRLSDDALALLQQDPAAFYRRCGDQFIASVTKGGMLRAIYRFDSLTEGQQRDIRGALGTSVTPTLDSTAQQTLQTILSNHHTELTVLRAGGEVLPFTPSTAEIIDMSRQFAAGVTQKTASPLFVSTKPYVEAENFPACAVLPDFAPTWRTMNALADEYNQASVARNTLARRLNMPGRLDSAECVQARQALTARLASLEEYLKTLQAKYAACRGAQPHCEFALSQRPDFALPVIPQECGPRCTSESGSTYVVDAWGYCTRCDYTGAPSIAHGTTGLFSTCAAMRPGSRVMGRLHAKISGVNTAGVGFGVQGDPAPNSCAVDRTHSDCWYQGEPAEFQLTHHARVPQSGVVSGYIDARYCQNGDALGSCLFADLTLTLCDEDAIDCR